MRNTIWNASGLEGDKLMRKIIVTADDYGMSQAVNEAINAGIDAGTITSTNVMTNMPYYKEAVELRKRKNISIGIHWVLSCGSPVLNIKEIPSLVNDQGEFFSYSEFRSRFRKGKINYGEIKKELLAQYNLFFELLGKPDYWNTHQNTHVDFGLYQFIVKCAEELGINMMRSHQRIYVPSSSGIKKRPLTWRILEPIKAGVLSDWQNKAHKIGLKSPDGVIVCLNPEDASDLKYMFNNIEWKDKRVGEFVIHPAVRNDSRYFGKITKKRIDEYKLFSDSGVLDIVRASKVQLVNFDEV